MSGLPAEGTAPRSRTLSIPAYYIARLHTVFALTAFGTALALGLALHYKKIVKNGVAGYPKEWFPSVSATIGDWYPERNVFQILIALTAGPRICLVLVQYYLHYSPTSSLPTVVFLFGLLRTLSCGGWVYITSTDDHDVHDIAMITYMVCNLPWMFGTIACSTTPSVRRKRNFIAYSFFAAIVPLVYFYLQHKVHRIPGAYTRYSFFEWGLILLDVVFDSIDEEEFKIANLQLSVSQELEAENETQQGVYTSQSKHEHDTANGHETEAIYSSSGDVNSSTTGSFQPRQLVSFLSDAYLSFVFWSIFTSLIPTLFYFSIWELGIAGTELALFATLSPIVLSSRTALWLSRTHAGNVALHLISTLAGLGAFKLRKSIHRLFLVAFGAAVAVLRQTTEWSGVNVLRHATMTTIGLLLSSLSKHANHANNPIWPMMNESTGGFNEIGMVLSMLAILELSFRPRNFRVDVAVATNEQSRSWLRGAIPLGALLYALHTYLSDGSTLIAWSWTGYENGLPRGPVPHLHGAITLVVQCVGAALGIASSSNSWASKVVSNPGWLAVGSYSSYVLYAYRGWKGYGGGLVFTVFIMSIIPKVLAQAALTGSAARTYFTAMGVYCLLALASVWTVAYAFVPGGVYLRERTDLVMIAQMACLSLGYITTPSSASLRRLKTLSPSSKFFARTLLAVISTLSVIVTLYRLPSTAPQPWRPGHRMFRAGIWTVHFGFDNRGRDSQHKIRNLIRDMELDVVGLLETDLHRIVYGNRDLTRVMIEDMGYYVDLGPGPNSHTWGCVLLSKFPIINSTHHLLPSPHGELAPAISAVLDMYGTYVTVVVSHNGQEEDPLDRELQSAELGRIMASSPYPTIFLGYVVTKPHAPRPAPYQLLVEDGNMYDIDYEDEDRWCEYILYRGVYRTAYARLSRGSVTDTELQVGQFVLPKHGESVVDDSKDARYLRRRKEELPVEHWFPMAYYGNKRKGGVNGHFYHVFSTPLYYDFPEGANV